MHERTTTRSDYAIRLERVFRWLADHLDDTLDLTVLAEVACMSPHHFHRIYHAMQGETAADTVRRLRLHRAAVELITGELPVTRIARRAGYGSQEAFTRAFKTAYGVPPARYRASFVPQPTLTRTEDAMDTTMTLQATVRETPAIRVAALAHHGDYLNIGSTFERLAAMAAGQGLFGPGRDRSASTTTIPRRPPATRCAPMRVSRCLRDRRPAENSSSARFAADATRSPCTSDHTRSCTSRTRGSMARGSRRVVKRPPRRPASRST
jgi:AraC family transcriptional regulator